MPVESERGVSLGLLGREERCEAKVGQMVADNEGVGRRGEPCCSQARAQQRRLCTDFRTRETAGIKVWEVEGEKRKNRSLCG